MILRLSLALFTVLYFTIGTNGLGVKLFDRKNRQGEYLRLEIEGCTNVPLHWDNQASSVDNEGDCLLFYEKEKCTGRQVALQPYHQEYQQNLAHERIGFSDIISSVSPCGKIIETGDYVIQNAADGSILTAAKNGVSMVLPWRPFILIRKVQQWKVEKDGSTTTSYRFMPGENSEDNPMVYDRKSLYEYDKETKVYQKNLKPLRNQWKVESAYRGKYRIRNVESGLCIVKGRREKVTEEDCDKWTPRQEWIFRKIPDPSKKSSHFKPPPAGACPPGPTGSVSPACHVNPFNRKPSKDKNSNEKEGEGEKKTLTKKTRIDDITQNERILLEYLDQFA